MQISDQTQKYLLVYGAILAIIFFIYKSSSDKFTCDGWANDFRDNKKFNLVLTKKENNYSRDAYFYGIDLKSKETTEFYDGSGWIARNFNKFMVGDTLIKNKGKYMIIIKRNGEKFLVPFECGNKIYIDK